jgi:hypothetical protein
MLQQNQPTATPPPPPTYTPQAATADQRLAACADLSSLRNSLTPERRNVADAMRLYTRLSLLLKDAITERDGHAYRRVRRVHRRSAARLERRHKLISPRSIVSLGNIHQAPAMPRPEARR